MEAITTVLAATDFSADAACAAQRAAQLAREHGAALRLVHVVEPDFLLALRDLVDTHRDLQASVRDQAGIELAAAVQALQQGSPGVQVTPVVREGRVLQELGSEEQQADVLVLGARGSHALRELALGTTADRLLRTATRPLLVVRQPPAGPYARVLVLADLEPPSAAALAFAARLAPAASLRLLHAVDLPFEGKLRLAGVGEEEIAAWRARTAAHAHDALERMCDASGQRLRTIVSVQEGDVCRVFLQALEDLRPDLVVVAREHHAPLSDLLLGSVTRVVLAEASCDVLVVPASGA
ncbi:MAG TPA: universal stress protein [Ramlibacter sp.]|uniref:universal stress protein n=1 Tax=Ramlibacter sp. TaxID=1917967 RepID=UPI002D7E8AD1|nr:universal stress protein [Ramlibacter sp.]HET8746969.1 universal stress protein [Ramlibacter sp.]